MRPSDLLVPVPFEWVSRYAAQATREGAVVKPTKRTTLYFSLAGREGFIGLIELRAGVFRPKAAYVFPEWRGFGFGAQMMDGAIDYAELHGAKTILVISLRPRFFDARGFTRVRPGISPGSWHLRKDY